MRNFFSVTLDRNLFSLALIIRHRFWREKTLLVELLVSVDWAFEVIVMRLKSAGRHNVAHMVGNCLLGPRRVVQANLKERKRQG